MIIYSLIIISNPFLVFQCFNLTVVRFYLIVTDYNDN